MTLSHLILNLLILYTAMYALVYVGYFTVINLMSNEYAANNNSIAVVATCACRMQGTCQLNHNTFRTRGQHTVTNRKNITFEESEINPLFPSIASYM